jgi:DNA polymerase III psi subunit
MSLNNINLSPFLVAQLYPDSLTGEPKKTGPAQKDPAPTEERTPAPEWKLLGSNQKNILVAVAYENITHLPDPQLDFLMQLLKACHLGLNDVALINMNNYKGMEYTDILSYFQTKAILLFGISAQEFGFPFEMPQYQVQPFTQYTVIHAPALHDLQNDKPAKGLLWTGLKKIFNL